MRYGSLPKRPHLPAAKPLACVDLEGIACNWLCSNRWLAALLRLRKFSIIIEAVQGTTELGVPVVHLSGVLSPSNRTSAMVSHDLPSELESYEQGLAFLTYYLRRHVRHLSKVPDWLHEGAHHQHLLPWERERAAYRARPYCIIQRDWLRVAFKTLAKQLATISDDATVTFEFDGSALIIRCAAKVIPMAGEGDPWPRSYSVKAGSIRELPTRLMQQNVEISVWERSLVLGNRRYRVLDEPA
jgi:hypothetical protein